MRNLQKYVLRHCQQWEIVILWCTSFADMYRARREKSKTCQLLCKKAFCRIPYLLRMLTLFFTVNKLYCYRGFISSLLLLCFVLFFGIQTPILHVCEASPLSPKAQQWSCGARWHDPVTQTHRRLHSDSGNRPPKQKSSIIYVQQLQPLIQCVGVTCPPLCRIDFLWVTNTAHTLYSVLHLTNLCSIIDMAFFFFVLPHCLRHGTGYAAVPFLYFHNYTVVLTQPAQKNTRSRGLENMTSHTLQRGKNPRGQSTVDPRRGSAWWSLRPLSDLSMQQMSGG